VCLLAMRESLTTYQSDQEAGLITDQDNAGLLAGLSELDCPRSTLSGLGSMHQPIGIGPENGFYPARER